MSPNKHRLRGPRGKYVSASEKTGLIEEGIISKSKPKVRKVDLEEEDSHSNCYDRPKEKPVHIDIDIDKEIAAGNKLTLALLLNRSEENEINNSGETRGRDGNVNLRRSNRIFKPSERSGTVPYF